MTPRRTGASEQSVISSTGWKGVLRIEEAEQGYLYAVRLRGAGVDYRVICGGAAGDETVSSGSITGTTPIRPTGLPTESWGGSELRIEAKLTGAGACVQLFSEVTWIPVEERRQP